MKTKLTSAWYLKRLASSSSPFELTKHAVAYQHFLHDRAQHAFSAWVDAVKQHDMPRMLAALKPAL